VKLVAPKSEMPCSLAFKVVPWSKQARWLLLDELFSKIQRKYSDFAYCMVNVVSIVEDDRC